MAIYNGYEGYGGAPAGGGAAAPKRQASITRPPTVAAPTNTYTPAWTASLPPDQQQPAGTPLGGTPYRGEQLTPQTVVGLSPEERQRIYNQARANFMGTTRAASQGLGNTLGGRGFVGGESGVADSAQGQLWGEGLRKYGDVMSTIATDEVKNRFQQGLDLDRLNIQQNMWSQEFGAGRMDRSTDDLLRYAELQQLSQRDQYAPYWNAVGQANLSEANYGGR